MYTYLYLYIFHKCIPKRLSFHNLGLLSVSSSSYCPCISWWTNIQQLSHIFPRPLQTSHTPGCYWGSWGDHRDTFCRDSHLDLLEVHTLEYGNYHLYYNKLYLNVCLSLNTNKDIRTYIWPTVQLLVKLGWNFTWPFVIIRRKQYTVCIMHDYAKI